MGKVSLWDVNVPARSAQANLSIFSYRSCEQVNMLSFALKTCSGPGKRYHFHFLGLLLVWVKPLVWSSSPEKWKWKGNKDEFWARLWT
jgi:hypothetical protein